MKESTFKKISEGSPKSPKIGDMFLEGEEMIKQKIKKNKGDIISYFLIVSINKGNIEYMEKQEKLT